MATLEVHFLDVGPTKYGDCVLIRHDGNAILIDAGHKKDLEGVDGFDSIPDQLDALLGGSRPHRIDLLVLTHCHDDHIGCMPELVSTGVIDVRRAYLADPALGWGETDGGPDLVVDARTRAILDVLREEGAALLRPSELSDALADAVGLRTRLQGMIDRLNSDSVPVDLCTGDEDRADIESAFGAIGLKILGPTKNHLTLCALQIAEAGRDALRDLQTIERRDSPSGDVDLLGRLIALRRENVDAVLQDSFSQGAALNCQSIVIALEFGGRKVLLTGDMQFTQPKVEGLDDEMTALRADIKAHGPFDLVKTAHHTANNGWGDPLVAEQLKAAGNKAFIVHTGGKNDPTHPAVQALGKLKDLNRSRPNDIDFLRTDRNGLISFTIKADGEMSYTKRRGRRDDFTPNSDVLPPAPPPAPIGEAQILQLPPRADGMVEVLTRIPTSGAKVRISIEVDPVAGVIVNPPRDPNSPIDPPPRSFRLAGGRSLPPLLFVTDKAALTRKIGRGAVDTIFTSIQSAGQSIVDFPMSNQDPVAAAARVRAELNRERKEGVVLIGGPDVAPSQRLDTLGPELRAELEDPGGDPDEFVVWNDELYVDLDDDLIPETPISRIPDGGEAQIVLKALQASDARRTSRFGIRNVRRPFANAVFAKLAGNDAVLVSEPHRSTQLAPRNAQRDFAYLMLHGDDADGFRFWGEQHGAILEAFTADQVPSQFTGVVLTGCCWGALTTSKRALHFAQGEPITVRTRAGSIALRFLAAGAQAFIGCTGVHYSPGGNQPTTAGGPMQTAFIDQWNSGEPPARALFEAKKTCLGQLPDESEPEELAIALKIIRQYTCLGLGW